MAVSSGGRSTVRMTMRWLATPMRTRLPSLCSANMSRRTADERLDVDDLAVTHDAGRERRRSGALDGHLARASFDGGDVAGLDVESDESL